MKQERSLIYLQGGCLMPMLQHVLAIRIETQISVSDNGRKLIH